MSSLHIEFGSPEASQDYVDQVPGMELVPGAHPFEALYGDDRAESAVGRRDFWPEKCVSPRRGVAQDIHPLAPSSTMPLPWPVVVGYDGMHPRDAGVAMKAENGAWVPVARFDPPLTDEDQTAADERAMERYLDRCAEHVVMGGVGATNLSGSQP